MVKTLAKCIREYKVASIITPIFMIFEVILEVLIPYFIDAAVLRFRIAACIRLLRVRELYQ